MRSSRVWAFLSGVLLAPALAQTQAQMQSHAQAQSRAPMESHAEMQSMPQSNATLQGTVTAAGSPLRDCSVSLYQIDARQQKAVGTIVSRTQEDGSYVFRTLRSDSYVLIVACAGERVYQGMVDVKSGQSDRRDIALADPFAGKWRLNAGKSTLGPFGQVREETREYSRAGDLVTMTWSRMLEGNSHAVAGSMQFKCDGHEYGGPDERLTCRFRNPSSVEGYQKPPLAYYVRSVKGSVLSIDCYGDPDHRKKMATLIYDRQ
jgi:hypothetical protein